LIILEKMLRRNLFAYLKTKGITCIVATHDSTDALSYADQTIVLQNGTLIDKAILSIYTIIN
jgi:ABC-type Fe3+/spermidine/putrescine transport system ATPase subunit